MKMKWSLSYQRTFVEVLYQETVNPGYAKMWTEDRGGTYTPQTYEKVSELYGPELADAWANLKDSIKNFHAAAENMK